MDNRFRNAQEPTLIKNFMSPVKENRTYANSYTPVEAVQRNGLVVNEKQLERSSNEKDFFTFKTASTN